MPLLLQGGFFIALLSAASLWDLKKRIIPDTICVFIALTGLFIFEPIRLLGIFAAIPFLLAALIWDGIGGGDIKLMAAAGLVLGLQKSMAAIIMGLTAMLVFHAIYTLIQRLRGRNAPKAYPLAPFLSLGCLAAYFLI
ncbi:A24 family peptidase [Dehalobacter sp. DCM]|uniref:prepilin peptidase n=1 Tax=Dehalobacter sp. DCM TaxID=2907827 RepID=UPI0030812594|nr:A24 family peptidase [Dehalobacter sp. DCM]